MAQRLEYVVGDTPTISCTWTGVDVTSYTPVLAIDTTTPTTITGSIDDGPNGQFSFAVTTQFDTAGTYDTQIRMTSAGGVVTTWRDFETKLFAYAGT